MILVQVKIPCQECNGTGQENVVKGSYYRPCKACRGGTQEPKTEWWTIQKLYEEMMKFASESKVK